jgi:anthranilate synthase/aminodeoxychorismate synthase-like glutamine amidotransferase
MARVLVIDNYDSFTYNLVQYLGELGAEIEVYRNDAISVGGIAAREPDRIVISPGPCTPREAGISEDVVRELGPKIPLLGVCLGHQAIGEVFGGEVVIADKIMHGKTSLIIHDGLEIFRGLDNPFEATRYHSLIVRHESLPDVLRVTAWTADKEIMGLKHRDHPIWGVQFHPESILTKSGKQLIANFLAIEP